MTAVLQTGYLRLEEVTRPAQVCEIYKLWVQGWLQSLSSPPVRASPPPGPPWRVVLMLNGHNQDSQGTFWARRSAASGRRESGLTSINKHNRSSLFVDSVFTSWLKFICNTQISICRCFCGHVQTCTEWRKFWVTRLVCTNVLSVIYLESCLSWFWVFLLVVSSLFKRSPSMLLSVTLKLRRLWCAMEC